MNDCVFCKIVVGKIPSCLVAQDDKTMAFMDIMPARKGHVLVVSKQHSEDITDVPEEDLLAMMKMVKQVATAVKKSLNPPGMSLVQLNGAASGQTVFHIHFHVIPRCSGDRLAMKWSHESYPPGEIEVYQAKIVEALDLVPSPYPLPEGEGKGV